MEKKSALTSKQMITYIADMADIEMREYTMQKVVESLEKNNRHLQQETASLRPHLENSDMYKRKRDETQKELQKHLSSPREKPVEPSKPEGYDQYYAKYETTRPDCDITVGGVLLRLLVSFTVSVFLTIIGVLLFYNRLYALYGHAVTMWILGGIGGICSFLMILFPVILKYGHFLKHVNAYDTYRPYILAYEQYTKELRVYQRYQRDLREYEEKYRRAEKEYQEQCLNARQAYQSKYDYTQAENNAFIDANIAQIDLLRNSISILRACKQELYELNVIPPDYRKPDCVLMLHQIFRNDPADTMRDAIRIYEERVLRREVIRGMDMIYLMLGELHFAMRDVELRLLEIKQKVQEIESDTSYQSAVIHNIQRSIFDLLDKTVSIQKSFVMAEQKWQEDMLTETRASRYASEAIRVAFDKRARYINDDNN